MIFLPKNDHTLARYMISILNWTIVFYSIIAVGRTDCRIRPFDHLLSRVHGEQSRQAKRSSCYTHHGKTTFWCVSISWTRCLFVSGWLGVRWTDQNDVGLFSSGWISVSGNGKSTYVLSWVKIFFIHLSRKTLTAFMELFHENFMEIV